MDRIDAVSHAERYDDRYNYDDGGIHVHHTAYYEQTYIQREQESIPGVHGPGHPLHSPGRKLCINQVVGEPERDTEDEQHPSNQQPTLGHDSRDLPRSFEVTI